MSLPKRRNWASKLFVFCCSTSKQNSTHCQTKPLNTSLGNAKTCRTSLNEMQQPWSVPSSGSVDTWNVIQVIHLRPPNASFSWNKWFNFFNQVTHLLRADVSLFSTRWLIFLNQCICGSQLSVNKRICGSYTFVAQGICESYILFEKTDANRIRLRHKVFEMDCPNMMKLRK